MTTNLAPRQGLMVRGATTADVDAIGRVAEAAGQRDEWTGADPAYVGHLLRYGPWAATLLFPTRRDRPPALYARRGFATETHRQGKNPLRIARHGGWKDGTLAGDIEDANQWEDNALTDVGL